MRVWEVERAARPLSLFSLGEIESDAIVAAGEGAIFMLAQRGHRIRKPEAGRDQHGKQPEGGQIDQHPMPIGLAVLRLREVIQFGIGIAGQPAILCGGWRRPGRLPDSKRHNTRALVSRRRDDRAYDRPCDGA